MDNHGSSYMEYDAEVDDRIVITSEDEEEKPQDMFKDD